MEVVSTTDTHDEINSSREERPDSTVDSSRPNSGRFSSYDAELQEIKRASIVKATSGLFNGSSLHETEEHLGSISNNDRYSTAGSDDHIISVTPPVKERNSFYLKAASNEKTGTDSPNTRQSKIIKDMIGKTDDGNGLTVEGSPSSAIIPVKQRRSSYMGSVLHDQSPDVDSPDTRRHKILSDMHTDTKPRTASGSSRDDPNLHASFRLHRSKFSRKGKSEADLTKNNKLIEEALANANDDGSDPMIHASFRLHRSKFSKKFTEGEIDNIEPSPANRNLYARKSAPAMTAASVLPIKSPPPKRGLLKRRPGTADPNSNPDNKIQDDADVSGQSFEGTASAPWSVSTRSINSDDATAISMTEDVWEYDDSQVSMLSPLTQYSPQNNISEKPTSLDMSPSPQGLAPYSPNELDNSLTDGINGVDGIIQNNEQYNDSHPRKQTTDTTDELLLSPIKPSHGNSRKSVSFHEDYTKIATIQGTDESPSTERNEMINVVKQTEVPIDEVKREENNEANKCDIMNYDVPMHNNDTQELLSTNDRDQTTILGTTTTTVDDNKKNNNGVSSTECIMSNSNTGTDCNDTEVVSVMHIHHEESNTNTIAEQITSSSSTINSNDDEKKNNPFNLVPPIALHVEKPTTTATTAEKAVSSPKTSSKTSFEASSPRNSSPRANSSDEKKNGILDLLLPTPPEDTSASTNAITEKEISSPKQTHSPLPQNSNSDHIDEPSNKQRANDSTKKKSSLLDLLLCRCCSVAANTQQQSEVFEMPTKRSPMHNS